jgi:hypothetical protein
LLQQSLFLLQFDPALPHLQVPFLQMPEQQFESWLQFDPDLLHWHLPLLHVPLQQSLFVLHLDFDAPHRQVPLLHEPEQQSLLTLQFCPALTHWQVPFLQVRLLQQSLVFVQLDPDLMHLHVPPLQRLEQQLLSLLQFAPTFLQPLAVMSTPCAEASRVARPRPAAVEEKRKPRRDRFASARASSSKRRSSTAHPPGWRSPMHTPSVTRTGAQPHLRRKDDAWMQCAASKHGH